MNIWSRVRSVSPTIRLLLFAATGLALPFFAFPVFKAAGKPVDLSTIFAALFVVSSLPGLLRERPSRSSRLLLAASAALPLLILVPPRPQPFAPSQFLSSYAHWLLLATFFFCAGFLRLSEVERRRVVLVYVIGGTVVALFALYQVVGFPRGWPGAGTTTFVSFQREPLRLQTIVTGYVRPTSLFLEPAWMGGYIAWIIALAVGWVAEREGDWGTRLPGALCLVVMLSALLASVSWGAYADLVAAVGAGGFAFFIVGSPSRRGLLAITAIPRWTRLRNNEARYAAF